MQIFMPRVNNLRTVSPCRERQWYSAGCLAFLFSGPPHIPRSVRQVQLAHDQEREREKLLLS